MPTSQAAAISAHPARTRRLFGALLFLSIYLLFGLYRVTTVLLGLVTSWFFRLSLAVLVYTFLGLVIAAALILVGASWLIACTGGQFRLP